jgi:hypothetical protein
VVEKIRAKEICSFRWFTLFDGAAGDQPRHCGDVWRQALDAADQVLCAQKILVNVAVMRLLLKTRSSMVDSRSR